MENNAKQYRLSFTEEAKRLVSQMTLDEKIYLMAANYSLFYYIKGLIKHAHYYDHAYEAGGCERLGVPKLVFSDGPRGVVIGNSTCFPVAMARGASFDRELNYRVGEAMGKECRAQGVNFFGGLCLNIPYNPGDGRSQETFGEDSYLIGEMGVATLQGVQKHNVIACIKHFAFNSMENARFKVNVTASKRTEREVYLPHFKKCIDAGAAALMTSYNKYLGSYCGHSKYLMRDVVKGEWGMDGPVMSDFLLGVRDTVEGITGGLDIEMRLQVVYSLPRVKRALCRKQITMEMIDDAALRIVRTLLAYAKAEDPMVYDPSLIACPEHIALARECAEKSITLIKNKGMLPLDTSKKIAIVGDLAAEENIGDHGSSKGNPPYIRTLLQALNVEYANVDYRYYSTREYRAAEAEISAADAVITVCGCRHCDEGEYIPTNRGDSSKGGDRESLSLKPEEVKMIQNVGRWNVNQAVILMGGNVILTHEWKDSAKAILFAYYAGMEGGSALADILFGKVNPSGKLPFAIAPSQDCYPDMDWDANEITYGYYHGFRKLDKDGVEADHPFGFGLSYTEFQVSDIRLIHTDKASARFAVTVTNYGNMVGGEVPQLYIRFISSAVDRPVKTLVDFQKVYLAPGESKTIELAVSQEALAYFDETKNCFIQEDIGYEALIGTSSTEKELTKIPFRFK